MAKPHAQLSQMLALPTTSKAEHQVVSLGQEERGMDCYPDEPVKAVGSEGSQMQKNHIQNKSTYIRCPEQANPSSRDRFPGQGAE